MIAQTQPRLVVLIHSAEPRPSSLVTISLVQAGRTATYRFSKRCDFASASVENCMSISLKAMASRLDGGSQTEQASYQLSCQTDYEASAKHN